MFATNRFKEIQSLFWPIAVAMMLSSVLSLIDSAMISHYDIVAVSSISIATQLQWIFGPMYFGVLSGINIYTVQYYARGDEKSLKSLVGIALTIIIPISIINLLVGLLFNEQIIGFFVDINSHMGEMALAYFDIIIFNCLLMPIDMIFMYQYRAIKNPKIPLYVSTIQASTNIVLNFILIYGLFGLPELGIEGAAIATIITRVVFIIVNLIIAKRINAPFIGKFKEIFVYSRDLFSEIVLKVLPLIAVEFGFGISKVIYTKIYTYASVDEFTAMQVSNMMSFMLNAFVIATANVSGILVGGVLSKEDEHELSDVLKNIFTFMLISSVSIVVFSSLVLPLLIPLFDAQYYALMIWQLLIINAVYMAIRVFSSTIIAILKAGGDTSKIIYIDAGMAYLVGIPVSLLALYLFGANIVILKIALISEVISKLIAGLIRLKQNKWKNKL